MAAFTAAIEAGFTHIETDARITADGVVVAFHDDTLGRVSDTTGSLAQLDWGTVRSALVAGEHRVPTIADLLERFPDTFINIDPKSDAVVEPLVRTIEEAEAINRVCIGSFSDRRIATLRSRLGPNLCTSLGPRAVTALRAASYGMPVGHIVGDCVQVPPTMRGVTLVDRRFVCEAHDRGMQVHVWTIDAELEMHRLLDLGVDGIMTDRLRALRAVLQARGNWPGDTTADDCG
jgi:glycerophosphoryl diester phosphodiesterase